MQRSYEFIAIMAMLVIGFLGIGTQIYFVSRILERISEVLAKGN